MPNVGSWNGQWTSAGNFHARVRNLPKKVTEKILENKNYYYNFGDGWGASVEVKRVYAAEAAKIRRNTKGFCGYDWMIDSIINKGNISR